MSSEMRGAIWPAVSGEMEKDTGMPGAGTCAPVAADAFCVGLIGRWRGWEMTSATDETRRLAAASSAGRS